MQLMAAALRAEKSIKGAQDQLKKAAAKREADARKPKATGQKPGEEGFTSALFDQGVAAAEQMVRVQLAELKAGALELDYSKPFVICANEWVADARKDQSSFCLAMNEFKSAFDEARKAKKGIRVSKPADPSLMTSFEFKGLLSDALKKSKTGGCVPEESMPEELKPLMVGSLFGIDAGYDRVSGETLGLPAVRLTLEGTRQVVVTEILQLVGFMTAKQVSGKMDVVRCSSFFKCLSASMISEYKAQCNLYASTLSPGDAIYVPCGSLCAELVSASTVGLRCPIMVPLKVHKNSSASIKKRIADLATKQEESGEEEGKKCASETAALKKWLAIASTD